MAIKQNWVVANGQQGGKPAFIRFNQAVKEIIGHPEYGFQVGIAIPLIDMDQHGLPTQSEAQKLDQIEDLLVEIFEKNKEAILVGTLTMPTFREFVLYASVPELIAQRFEELKQLIKSHEVQMVINEDKDWQIYKGIFLGKK